MLSGFKVTDANGNLKINSLGDPVLVTHGGTGLATFAQGDLIYASAANTLLALTKNASASRYLSNSGASNNPAWAQVDLTNGVTGVLPPANLATTFTTTSTGNVDDLDFSNAALIRFNNASLATLRGLKAGTDGQKVTIVSIGAGQVDCSHQDTGDATAGSRLINFVTSGKTSLAAGVGSATYQYDGTTLRWRLVAHEQGASIVVAYAGGNFTISGGTWTVDAGDQKDYSYYLRGRMLFVNVQLDTTSVTNTGSSGVLLIAAPSYTPAANVYRVLGFTGDNSTTSTTAFIRIRTAAPTQLECSRFDGAAWTNSTNNTYTRGDIEYQVT